MILFTKRRGTKIMGNVELTIENARVAARFVVQYCHRVGSTNSRFEFTNCQNTDGKSYEVIVRVIE